MKTCIITGASDGIGKATAIKLSCSKYYQNFVIIGRNTKRLSDTYEQMNPSKQVMKVVYDLEVLNGIPNLVKSVVDKFSSIDCLINVAGYADPRSLLSMTNKSLIRTYAVNVFAPLILTRECVKYMKFNKGVSKIVNIGSTSGITPRPGWLSYASSKAALISSSLTLSEELAEYNIKVYSISPGRCATALRRRLAPDEDQSKIMQPEEVGAVISNLVSKSETILDGQNIVVRKKSNE